MKRTPLVLTGTVMGLAGVMSFHTAPVSMSLNTLASSASASTSSTTSTPTTSTTASTTRSTTARVSSSTASTTSTTLATSTTRRATGTVVNYGYGELSVTVTVRGTKITSVGIGAINDGGNFRSESIDQMAIPVLEREAMSAQSANIQSVSGASYTSEGFIQSLQAALTTLGIS